MINVDFTTNSGETVYSYSWQNCDGNKNVNFELENPSYTWCTVTHTPENSKVKIHADAVPERQRDPRSAKVLMKVNDVTCDEFFYVSQPGQPCGCSAFTPISIGATFPSSGADVGTVIGSYYNDTTCDASKITITGDLQAEAVGGQIKLTSAVGAYDDGRTFNVIFNYDGSECTRGTCTQSAATCRCTTITATPYTFAALDTCGGMIMPVTVLTIDGCCSIETGITGTDSDKFTVSTGTSGSNSIVKVCPNSQNTSTSTDRTATVSVTATCGNETCYSSTTITQEHSAYTPSCNCGQFLSSRLATISYGIASTGIGNSYQTLWEIYVTSEDCANMCTISTNPECYPSSPAIVPSESITSVTNATYDGVSCKKITLSAKNMPANSHGRVNMLFYSLYIDGNYCVTINIDQNADRPCSCDSFVEGHLIEVMNTVFSTGATSNRLIATGATNGCGSLSASTEGAQFVTLSAVTHDTTIIIEGQPEVVETTYEWYASVEPTTVSRSAMLRFTYIDRDGVEQPCNQTFLITQYLGGCECPEITINDTLNIDGAEHGYLTELDTPYYWDGDTTSVSLTRYGNGSFCQFVIAESDSDWCSGFTKMSTSNQLTESFIISSNTGQTSRTAVVNYYAIANVPNNAVKLYQTYAKDDLSNYGMCGKVGSITIIQEPFGVCDCITSEFRLRDGYEPNVTGSSNSYYWQFYRPKCGTLSYKYVDADGNEIERPDWVNCCPDFSDYNGFKKFDVSFQSNPYSSQRTAFFKIILTTSSGQLCEIILSYTQEACGCSNVLIYDPDDTVSNSAGIIIVKVGADACGVQPSDIHISLEQSAIGWVNYVDTYVSGDGYVYIELAYSENDWYTRDGYYTISMADCERRGHLKQKAAPCADCDTIENSIDFANNPIDFYISNSGVTKTIATITNAGDCKDVAGFDYNIEYAGAGTGWLTITTSNDKLLANVNDVSPAIDRERTFCYLDVYPLDGNGNRLGGSDCSRTYRIFIYNDMTCGCSNAMSNPSDYISIPDATLSTNSYDLNISASQTSEIQIGSINVPYGMRSCLSYTVNNEQGVTVRLVETQRSDSGTTWTIYAKVNDSSQNTASSTLAIYDTSTNTECTVDYGVTWVRRVIKFNITH